jgi:predicted Zn-dependent protease
MEASMRIALVLLTVSLWAQTPEQLRLSQQGKQLMGAGRFAEAVPVYQALTKQVPGNPGLQLNLGIALHMAGRDLEAVAVLEPVTKQLPQAFPAFILLGTSYMRLGQPSKAAGPLERAVQMAPQDVEARRILADALLASNRNLAAKPHLEALATQTPKDPAIWFGLGRLYEGLAGDAFEQLRRTAPESAGMVYLLAQTREKQGRKAAAEALYAKARALSPKPPGCPSAYCTIQDFDAKARGAFAKLAELGDTVEWRQTRASILTNQNKHKEAAAEWRAALKMAVGRPDLEQGLAASLYAAQQFDEAEALLRKLVKGEPGNAELQFLLGDCLLAKGDAEAATPSLRRAFTLNPKFPPLRASLGRALAAGGKMAEAVPHLEAALPYDEDGATHFQLSRAYAATGQKAKAEAMAKRAQELRQ